MNKSQQPPIVTPFEDVTPDQRDLIVRICKYYEQHPNAGKKIFIRPLGTDCLLWFEGESSSNQLSGVHEVDLHILADEQYLFLYSNKKTGMAEWCALKQKAYEAYDVHSK